MQEDLVFKLEKSVQVSVNSSGKNTFEEIDTIYLKAHSYKDKSRTLPLKQAFLSAQTTLALKMSKSIEESQKREIKDGDAQDSMNATTIKMILFASGEDAINLPSFFVNFEKFLINGIAFKDSDFKQSITALELGKLSEFDFEELVAKYIEVFMASSWARTLS